MAHRHETLAQEVVEQFKQLLPDEVCRQISSARFEELGALVRHALSREAEIAAEAILEALERIRADIEPSEREL